MGRADPFTGYSTILRILIYGVIPLLGAWQFVRLKRAFHVFQLEAYKRHWFRDWCRADRKRSLFLSPYKDAKKPLVMTGRAWRTVVTGVLITVFGILVPAGTAHLIAGAPFDLITFGILLFVMIAFPDKVLLAADVVVSPVQRLINNRFLTEARRKLTEVDPVVIGVTGSYGKTSTKVAIQKILGGKGEAFATPASFNTPLGVARSINESLTDAHRYFVVEMGARQEGDVAEIVSLVGPSIGVLTAIGPAHLESFGSMDAIRRGKYEIIEGLPTNGVAVMNVDDLEVRTLADQSVGKVSRVLRYGVGEAGRPSVTATDIKVHQRGTDFTIVEVGSGHRIPVSTKLLGTHAIGHVLAGVAVALALGIELSEVAARIDGLEPVEHRLQIIEGAGGVTVIDDAYNSNPAGANAALEVLASMPARRRVVITPGMVELGAEQAAANETFGRRAASVADAVIFVAKVNRAALVAGGEAAAHAQVIVVDSLSEASARLPDLIGPGDVVLFENDLPDHHET